jgi:hypothetical protein
MRAIRAITDLGGSITALPGIELGADRWQLNNTVTFDSAASEPSTSARAASMSRSDRPPTQPEMTNDSRAFVRATADPNSREHNASPLPLSFGRCSSSGPSCSARPVVASCHDSPHGPRRHEARSARPNSSPFDE